MSEGWYYQTDKVYGPVTSQQLLQQVKAGVIQRDTLVCKGEGGTGEVSTFRFSGGR
jgi:hypothetical protein